MAYVTASDFLLRYPLAERWIGQGSNSIINSFCIHFAQAEMDALLAPHYAVPFSAGNLPAVVVDMTMELCKVRVLQDQDQERAEKIRQSVIDRIKTISNGSLVGADGTTITPNAPGAEIWSNTMEYDSTHSMLDPEGEYTGVDSSMLYDMEVDRGR